MLELGRYWKKQTTLEELLAVNNEAQRLACTLACTLLFELLMLIKTCHEMEAPMSLESLAAGPARLQVSSLIAVNSMVL